MVKSPGRQRLGGGRDSRFVSPDVEELRILKHREGYSDREAAKHLEIAESTYRTWRESRALAPNPSMRGVDRDELRNLSRAYLESSGYLGMRAKTNLHKAAVRGFVRTFGLPDPSASKGAKLDALPPSLRVILAAHPNSHSVI